MELKSLGKQSAFSTTNPFSQKQKLTPHAPPFIQVRKYAMARVKPQLYRGESGDLSSRNNHSLLPDLTTPISPQQL